MSRAQQNSTARRRLVPAALGFGIVIALAGCSAGQVTQTASQVAAVNGANGQAGQVAVRNAQLAFPASAVGYYRKGTDAPLVVSIANDGASGDRLVSVSSPAAGSATVQGSPVLPAGFALSATEETAQRGAESSAAPTPSSPGTPSTAPAGRPGSASPSPTGAAGPLPPGKIAITLVGLNRDVRPGETIKITFTFQNVGPVTLDVPIAAPAESERH